MPDALMNACEMLPRRMPKRRPEDRRGRSRVLKYVKDRIEETQRGQLHGERLEALRDVRRQRFNEKRRRGFHVWIIRRTGDADTQPFEKPADQYGRGAGPPPILAMAHPGGINGVEGTHGD